MDKSILPERLKGQRKTEKQRNFRKQAGLFLFTALIIGLIAYGSYYFFIPKQETYQLDFYTYAEVGTGDFLETLSVPGVVLPAKVVALEPFLAGIIEEVFVQEGQDVQAGEPLIRLYAEEVVEEKNSAETELSEAQTQLAELGMDQELERASEELKILEAHKQLEKAANNYELQKILFAYGAIPQVQLEEAAQEVEAAKRGLAQSEREGELLQRKQAAQRSALQKTIAISQEKLDRALGKMEHFTVKAPFAGRILSLKIPANRLVTAHQELGQLADLGVQVVEAQVAPGQTERFGLGTKATISLGLSDYEGEVSYIAPQATQGADGATVLVRIEFLEEVSHLRPNSAVTCQLHLKLHKNSLFLPRGAYLSSGQQLFVYVLAGQTARKREVQFGLIQGNAVQIRSGLEVGERVILSSYDAFRHLDEIIILPTGGHGL